MSDSDPEQFYECHEGNGNNGDLSTKTSSIGSSSLTHPAEQSSSMICSYGVNLRQVPLRSTKETDSPISVWGSRTSLPSAMFSRSDFSVWSILKHCIGMELSKITMPVIFNEPLSFLQRVVEYMEYFTILKRAADSNDPIERHELVTAFAVSATASNWDRIGKPFNPLLGETYELNREDLGFRVICEQVSHHPPVSAFHVDSPQYTFHGSIHPKLKFWGKSVEITPKGLVTLYLKRFPWEYALGSDSDAAIILFVLFSSSTNK